RRVVQRQTARPVLRDPRVVMSPRRIDPLLTIRYRNGCRNEIIHKVAAKPVSGSQKRAKRCACLRGMRPVPRLVVDTPKRVGLDGWRGAGAVLKGRGGVRKLIPCSRGQRDRAKPAPTPRARRGEGADEGPGEGPNDGAHQAHAATCAPNTGRTGSWRRRIS